jgi:hypothetical protein
MKEATLGDALADWARTQNAGPRAATLLLIDHGHWLTNRGFVNNCTGVEEGTAYVDWDRVKELLDTEQLIGTGSELALLWFAWDLSYDAFNLTSLDGVSRQLVVDALAHALGVTT